MRKIAKIEHERLDSTMATVVALHNEWIKWCTANDISAEKIYLIGRLFVSDTPPVQKGKK